MNLFKYLIIISLILPCSAYTSELPDGVEKQIDHLLTFISTSPCMFMRNGTWYAASDAAEHIRKKYYYVLGKGLVDSPEDFVKYSATKSSMSGEAYMVKCGDEAEISSADWLYAELSALRANMK